MLAKSAGESTATAAGAQARHSHLRLVTKIARDYRGYGVPISEAISDGPMSA